MNIKHVMLLIFIILFSGCAEYTENLTLALNKNTKIENDEVLVFMTLTQNKSSSCNDSIFMLFEGKEETNSMIIKDFISFKIDGAGLLTELLMESTNYPKDDIDAKSYKGKVIIHKFKKGNYEVSRIVMQTNDANHQPRREKTFKLSKKLEYNFTKNGVYYLGNLDSRRLKRRRCSQYSQYITLSDKYDRDIKLLHKKFPFIKEKDINKSVYEYESFHKINIED